MVGDVLAQQQPQMIRADHHDVVEELAADGQHPSLSDTVLPRRPWRDNHGFHAQGAQGVGDEAAVLSVLIEDEVARGRVVRERLAELPDDPLGVRVLGDGELQDPAAVMVDDEEDMEQLDGVGLDEDQGVSPARPRSAEPDSEGAGGIGEAQLGALVLVDGELLPEGEVLENEVVAWSENRADQQNDGPD